MIINIRGTNGSGKSTIARALRGVNYNEVGLVPFKTAAGSPRWVPGYVNRETRIGVVGSYETECGGCDTIKTQDLICDSVRRMATIDQPKTRHVVFEGVLVSTILKRYLDLAREFNGTPQGPFVWAFLQTPAQVCLDRIQARNGGKPIKEELVVSKIRQIENVRRKVEALPDQTVVLLDSDEPFTQLAEFIAQVEAAAKLASSKGED
jgi:gluconate kinase